MDEKTGNSLVHLPRVRLSVIVCLSRLFFLALIWSVEFDAACRPTQSDSPEGGTRLGCENRHGLLFVVTHCVY